MAAMIALLVLLGACSPTSNFVDAVADASELAPMRPLAAEAAFLGHVDAASFRHSYRSKSRASAPSKAVAFLPSSVQWRRQTLVGVLRGGHSGVRATKEQASYTERASSVDGDDYTNDNVRLFEDFATFLQDAQQTIIDQLEVLDGSGQRFTRDCWGTFTEGATGSGGITRVVQRGSVIEKGACSLTVLRNGKLTKDRAASIQGRQQKQQDQHQENATKGGSDRVEIREGDEYSAAALSIVLHTRSPMVPVSR